MTPKQPIESVEPSEMDSFAQFKQTLDMLVAQRTEIEQQIADLFQQQMVNLQIYFNKLLSTPQEQQHIRPQYQVPPYQPQYQPPYQQPQQPYCPPQTPIIDSNIPKWEKEEVKVVPKKKRSNKLLIIGGIVLVLMAYFWYAGSHGWSCAIGG